MSGAAVSHTARYDRGAAYGIAAIIGFAAIAYLLPWQTIDGAGMFTYPTGDLAENLLGHLAYQAPGVHWPLLSAPSLGRGTSIAMTDSNPAVSVPAKLIAAFVGHRVNMLGAWLALCVFLQPVAAVYAMRMLSPAAAVSRLNGIVAALLAAILSLLLPEYLFRVFHINLLGQFVLIAALGNAAASCRRSEALPFLRVVGPLALALLIHPYLFIFCAALLGAPGLHLLLHGAPGAREGIRQWALACMVLIAAFMLLNGVIHTGGPGFGLYSMNLLAPVWPQFSGLFGARLSLLDATGYQHEGFNYLGAGLMLLAAVAACQMLAAGSHGALAAWRQAGGLIVVLGCLFMLAVTPHITIGKVNIPIDVPVLDRLLAPVRASGRAIWAVDYAIMLAATGYLAQRLRPAIFLPLAVTILALQWIDTQPLRHHARAYLRGVGQHAPDLIIPDGTTLFSIVPLCESDSGAQDQYTLMAIRRGAALRAVRTATPQTDAACTASQQSGVQTPLQSGETRLFLAVAITGAAQLPVSPGLSCARVAQGLLCHRP